MGRGQSEAGNIWGGGSQRQAIYVAGAVRGRQYMGRGQVLELEPTEQLSVALLLWTVIPC